MPNRVLPSIILIGTFILCLLAIGIYIGFFIQNGFDKTPAGWGQLGDYIGGIVGTIVGTSTVIFLLFTLNSQNKTKNDNFFFYLLQLNEKQVIALDGVVSNKHYTGKEFLRALVVECRIIYHTYSDNEIKVTEFLQRIRPSLLAYLEHNKEIINYLTATSNEITKSHSVNYKNIYLAQFSNEEKIILGYFCALMPDPKIREFYVVNKIKDSIDYEPHLDGNAIQKPDAIKRILEILI